MRPLAIAVVAVLTVAGCAAPRAGRAKQALVDRFSAQIAGPPD
ncbi:hypothetical protein [Nonomuraea sp. NPDC003804]